MVLYLKEWFVYPIGGGSGQTGMDELVYEKTGARRDAVRPQAIKNFRGDIGGPKPSDCDRKTAACAPFYSSCSVRSSTSCCMEGVRLVK